MDDLLALRLYLDATGVTAMNTPETKALVAETITACRASPTLQLPLRDF